MINMFKRNLHPLLPLFILVGLSACSGRNEEKNEASIQGEKRIAVTLSNVSADSQAAILVSGSVEAAQTANISTRVMGRITNIFVKAGDRVHKGQLLATVWDEDLKAKRAQADAMIAETEAVYATTQKDYDRFNNLYKQQSATAKELDNVTQQYNSAKARLAGAKQMRTEVNANLSYSSLRAPFDGVVTQKLTEAGSLAIPGMPLMIIEQNGILRVSAAIAETDILHIHLGDTASVLIKSTGNRFNGKVIQTSPSSQFTGGQYIVKISIPDTAKEDIYSGMFASISIPMKDERLIKNDAILIPKSAIINRDELTGIYTVSADNTALLRWIRLGKLYGDKVEVLSGLSKDEKFIRSSESKLYNGAPIVVKEAEAPIMTSTR
jgi:RND family efflux transporter MFP subunit